MVDCLTVAAGILARSQEVIKGTGADQRFVKKRFQKCGVSSFFLINISSYLLSDSYNDTLFKPLHSVYVIRYWLMFLYSLTEDERNLRTPISRDVYEA